MMSGSSSSATVRVEKATSDLLINPDWTMNMDICDFVNTNPGQARDVLKAIKKRLQHKSPKVHFLALTLLETMVQNCGDYVHFQIVEKNILDDMVKIVKKKTDMNVRHKTLELLDAWQVGFGGQGGKYPQYYYAYDELRRSGVQFPQRSQHAAPPIFTPQPPIAQPMVTQVQGFGMPSNSSRRLDEAMASERESLSASTMDSMQNVTELLAEMLQAMNPDDSMATKDDIVVDVVDRCRANQKKLMQMLITTEDEELLGRGLELHDDMQTLLAKHDAIASGSPMPIQQTTSSTPQTTEKHNLGPKESEEKQEQSPKPCVSPSTSATTAISKGFIDEEEEEDDDFAQLARRHYKPQSCAQESTIENAESSKSSLQSPIESDSKALALTDPPVPVKTTREQDMIDLLSLALTTTTPYAEETSQIPPTNQNLPVSPSGEDPYAAHSHPSDPRHPQVPLQQEYVAPWADPHQQESFIQQQHQQGPFSQQPQLQRPFMQPPQQQSYLQPHQQQPFRQQPPPQYPPNTYGYPPPPWATSSVQNTYVAEEEVNKQPPQTFNSFSSSMGSSNGPHLSTAAVNGAASSTRSKPYVPPYKLFEDLNVLGSRDSGSSNTSSTSLSGQSRVGGWT